MIYDLLCIWWFTPARWWQFWLPQSGPAGGLIMAAVFIMVKDLL